MRTKLTVVAMLICTLNFSHAQINPIEIIDKIAGTLLPKIVEGVKEIGSSKRRDKDEAAKKMEEQYKKELDKTIKQAKNELTGQFGKDIEYLEAINQVQLRIERVGNDVGRLSIFKDVHFIDVLRNKNAVTVKNEIVRKFQNAFEQVYGNKESLVSLRETISSKNIPSSGKAAVYIGSIISKLEEINASYNDCPKLNNSKITKKDDTNACLDAIKSIAFDIAILETQVENLNTEIAAMLRAYIVRFEGIKDSLNKQ